MFDVIVGNPPYTHLRNLNDRRYAAYPKQRDMAQVFVRWALDHMAKTGVVSYNTSYTWLNKTIDGAVETRLLLNRRIIEIIHNEAIIRYSEADGGGDIPTCVLCVVKDCDDLLFNDQPIAFADLDLSAAGLINRCENNTFCWPFRHASIANYFISDSATQSRNKKGSNTNFWSSFVYNEIGLGDFYLMFKRAVFEHTYLGSFKLVRCSDPVLAVHTVFESQIMHPQVALHHGLWLIGYLNTVVAKTLASRCTVIMPNHGGWCAKFAANKWYLLQVPDFDFYKQTYPERFATYMSWIEENMRDKDAFLAGIDQQFEALICST